MAKTAFEIMVNYKEETSSKFYVIRSMLFSCKKCLDRSFSPQSIVISGHRSADNFLFVCSCIIIKKEWMDCLHVGSTAYHLVGQKRVWTGHSARTCSSLWLFYHGSVFLDQVLQYKNEVTNLSSLFFTFTTLQLKAENYHGCKYRLKFKVMVLCVLYHLFCRSIYKHL